MNHRRLFAVLLEARFLAVSQNAQDREAATQAYRAALIEAARKLPAKKSKKGAKPVEEDAAWASRTLGFERQEAILQAHREPAEAMDSRYDRRIKRIDHLLEALAARLPVQAGETSFVFDTVWSTSYATQGWGADRYAQNAAESRADIARLAEVPVEVIRGEGPFSQYEVRVRLASQVDLEILRRKPGPSLREQIRLCWKRGVNPRVYNPYLPVGLEERLGLDYFGGERAVRA